MTTRFLTAIAFFLTLMAAACNKTRVIGDDVPPISDDNNKSVGASARELLTATKPKLVLEINYMPGYRLQTASVDNLVNFLNTYLNKPGGVQVVEKQIAASSKDPLSVADIGQIEKDNRTFFNTDEQVAVYVLVTNSGYTNANTLGIAYRNTSVCLFGKTIHNNSGALGQASRVKVESTVLNHEGGHIMGLVDLGTPMVTNHKDASHPGHCNNSSCLMYYAAETTDILGLLITGAIPSPDANCRNDLKANGGK